MRALLFVLAIGAATAEAAFRVTPEQTFADQHPAAPRDASPSAVATDGSSFLVIWIGTGGLMATIVSDAGEIAALPQPPQVAVGPSFSEMSAVWTGSAYLVTWSGRDDNLPAVFAATLSRDGKLLRQPYVAARNAVARSGALARGARGAFQAYLRADVMQLKGALFDNDGALIAADTSLPFIKGAVDPTDVVRVASDGEQFALVWRTADYVPIGAMSTPPPLAQRFDTFHLQRIHSDGTLVGAAITMGRAEATHSFDVAYGGGKYAVVASEQQLITPGQTRPMTARFIADARNGAVSALPRIPSQSGDSVIWNGSTFIAYGVSYASSPQSFTFKAVRFSGEPESIAPQPVTLLETTHLLTSVFLASNGKNVLAAWMQDTVGGARAVYGALLDNNATKFTSDSAPFLVSVSWSRQYSPAIATSGNESLVVWVDETGGYPGGGLLGIRIAPSGIPIDASPFLIASATIFEDPVVTFTGATYLVVWNESSADPGVGTIQARTVGRDGSLGSRTALGAGWGLSAASSSAMTLVAFNASQSAQVVGCRFTPDGERLDQQPIIIGSGFNPAVATNGTDFFVAWNVGSDYWQWPPPDYIDVVGARVTASGAVDAAPLPIATGSANQVLAAVGGDGRDYLVVYALFSQSPPHSVLAAKRVLRDGSLDAVTATEAGTIVFDGADEIQGARYAMVIGRDQTGFWLAWPTQRYPDARIVLLHTDASGHPDDPITLLQYDGSQLNVRVALAKTATGSVQIVYARSDDEGSFAGTSRLFLRFAGESGNRWRAARH